MHRLLQFLSPGIIGILAVFLSIIWMLRNEKDKTRPLLVFALVLNLFYGWLLTFFLGKEDSLVPNKYDYILHQLDGTLGISAAAIAIPLQGGWRQPLFIVYELMIPMMIAWFLAVRGQNDRQSLVLAYIAELVAGPILYAILPACGPIYAFGPAWLHPPAIAAQTMRLTGMPNAFPSLHIATAFVLVLFARGKILRAIALAFLLATALATVATGEHYLIDLIPGLIFGCFAASAGCRQLRSTVLFLAVALFWSLAARFEYPYLIASPVLLRSLVVVTLAIAIWTFVKRWRTLDVEITVQSPELTTANLN